MQNVALLYYTIKKIQRFEDRVIWRVNGRFSRTIARDYAVFFLPGEYSETNSEVEFIKYANLLLQTQLTYL